MTGVTQSQPITTDIVERIRNLCTHDDGPEPAERLLDEAADEIEALRHDLDRHMQIAAEALTASANGEASGVAYTVPSGDRCRLTRAPAPLPASRQPKQTGGVTPKSSPRKTRPNAPRSRRARSQTMTRANRCRGIAHDRPARRVQRRQWKV
jgi:hypothetical protein